jgi:transcriptional regulator with XRE-family HTH domain
METLLLEALELAVPPVFPSESNHPDVYVTKSVKGKQKSTALDKFNQACYSYLQESPRGGQVRMARKEQFVTKPLVEPEAMGELGAKIRARRRQLGLSLRELGKRAGLSAAFLSLVERGQAKPALSSLVSLAKALEVSPEFLINTSLPEGGKLIRQLKDLVFFHLDGLPIRYAFLSQEMSDRKLDIILVEIPPGYTSEVWRHPYVGEEFIYVLSGRLKIWLGNREFFLGPGDSTHFRSNLRHRWANPDQVEARVLWVGTPPFWR